jgi:hypothetical protein
MASPIAASSSTEPSESPYQAFCTVDHSEIALNSRYRAFDGAGDRQRLIGGNARQQRQRVLIASPLDDGDGFEFLDLGGVGLVEQDRRTRLAKRRLGGLVGFGRQRAVDHRQHGLVVGLEYRLRGLDSLCRIGREQGQSAQRGLYDAAQLVVETHRTSAVRYAGNGGTGRSIDGLAVGACHENFLCVRIGHQAAVPQRADDGKGQRIA